MQSGRKTEAFALLAEHADRLGQCCGPDTPGSRRIQQLTSEGLNLAGVTKVLELERRIAHLERELKRTTEDAATALDAIARQRRSELVPIPSAAVVLYDQTRRRR